MIDSSLTLSLSLQSGKKTVKAVLWVSADGLRVVDDKTKVGVCVRVNCPVWSYVDDVSPAGQEQKEPHAGVPAVPDELVDPPG